MSACVFSSQDSETAGADWTDVVVGRLQTNPRGFGFVVPEQADADHRGDIFVAASNLLEAMHGDRVVARVERHTDKGLEGRIIRVLERSHLSFTNQPGIVVSRCAAEEDRVPPGLADQERIADGDRR